MKNRSPNMMNASDFTETIFLWTLNLPVFFWVECWKRFGCKLWPQTIPKKRTSEWTNRNIMSSMSFTRWSKVSRSSHNLSPLVSIGSVLVWTGPGQTGQSLWKDRLSFVDILIWPARLLPSFAIPRRPVIHENNIFSDESEARMRWWINAINPRKH